MEALGKMGFAKLQWRYWLWLAMEGVTLAVTELLKWGVFLFHQLFHQLFQQLLYQWPLWPTATVGQLWPWREAELAAVCSVRFERMLKGISGRLKRVVNATG